MELGTTPAHLHPHSIVRQASCSQRSLREPLKDECWGDVAKLAVPWL